MQELAASLIRVLDALLDSPDGYASDMPRVLECIFVESLVWSVGACVDWKGRHLFSEYLRMVLEHRALDTLEAHCDFVIKNRNWTPRGHPVDALPPPDAGLLYDVRFDAKAGQWRPWLEAVSGERGRGWHGE